MLVAEPDEEGVQIPLDNSIVEKTVCNTAFH